MKVTNGHETKYEIVSCGVDWITATASGGKPSKKFDELGRAIMERDMDRGKDVVPQTRLGFVGYTSDGFFLGHRGRERMMIASGARANVIAPDIIPLASNISRLDAQVTIITDGDRPNLARHGYGHLTSNPTSKGRRSKLTLIQSQPEGDTLMIGSRRSDLYARLYDKGVEAALAQARTLWRYEVECKRGRALSLAHALVGAESVEACSTSFVHEHFLRKGLEPFYSPAGVGGSRLFAVERADSDPLRWFRSTVSKAIQRAAHRYGWAAVLDALELDASLNDGTNEGGAIDAESIRPVQVRPCGKPVRADNNEQLPLHDAWKRFA